jgi:hypothetical protein
MEGDDVVQSREIQRALVVHGRGTDGLGGLP